eukprot:GHVP01031288.1.p1 GENE.GHVP01031288.1~~GHVP01031288.1.p1  ORF type:complete len:181 (-),score=28.84 GHVP01031288.1:125-667(-)
MQQIQKLLYPALSKPDDANAVYLQQHLQKTSGQSESTQTYAFDAFMFGNRRPKPHQRPNHGSSSKPDGPTSLQISNYVAEVNKLITLLDSGPTEEFLQIKADTFSLKGKNQLYYHKRRRLAFEKEGLEPKEGSETLELSAEDYQGMKNWIKSYSEDVHQLIKEFAEEESFSTNFSNRGNG